MDPTIERIVKGGRKRKVEYRVGEYTTRVLTVLALKMAITVKKPWSLF